MRLERTLPLIFFSSGAAALVSQMAWQRLLVLFAGGDVHAMSITVGAFMAGMGAGSFAGGHWVDAWSVRKSVRIFAAAELGIGACALGSPWLFGSVLYPYLARSPVSAFWRGLALFACLLAPTFLMGLSLPLLTRVLSRSVEGKNPVAGILYGTNTLGAAVGAGLATWVLMPLGGVEFSLRVAAAVNAMCGTLALFGTVSEELPPPSGADEKPPGEGHILAPLLAAFFLSGFAALGAEMVWVRVLGAVAKASAHTQGTLLSLYLGGMGLGALAGTGLSRGVRSPWKRFLQMQGAAISYSAVGVTFWLWVLQGTALREYLASYEPVDADTAVQLLRAWWTGTLNPSDAAMLWVHPLLHVMVPFCVMFPATFLMGWSFPLLQRAASASEVGVGWRTGALQAANILGSVGGTAGVFGVLLPFGGSTSIFRVLALVGAGFLGAASGPRGRMVALLAGIGMVVLTPGQKAFWSAVHGTVPDQVWMAEDASGVSVLKKNGPDGRVSVFTNGIGQSWIPYGGIHTLLGVLPVLLHENPERVAVIGLGSGDTLYGLLAREKTREVWCAEIVSGQRQTLHAASRDAGMDAVRKLLEDPRVRFIEGDGRMLLARASEGFDIIEADALRPTSAHAGTLYSEQYYALLKARLRPGGMAVTWLPTQRVAATLARVFPHVTVFGGVLGIGTQTPLNLDAARLGAVLQDPKVAAHFQQAGIALPALLELVMGPGKVIQTVGPDFDRSTWGETNSDFFPRDEWGLPSLWGRRGR